MLLAYVHSFVYTCSRSLLQCSWTLFLLCLRQFLFDEAVDLVCSSSSFARVEFRHGRRMMKAAGCPENKKNGAPDCRCCIRLDRQHVSVVALSCRKKVHHSPNGSDLLLMIFLICSSLS